MSQQKSGGSRLDTQPFPGPAGGRSPFRTTGSGARTASICECRKVVILLMPHMKATALSLLCLKLTPEIKSFDEIWNGKDRPQNLNSTPV